MSDAHCESVQEFAARGGAVIASGLSSLYDEWGEARPDFALADLFGAHAPEDLAEQRKAMMHSVHSYLRLSPELRAKVWGPEVGSEPKITGKRHPVLNGFDETDILPFGGVLSAMRVDAGAIVPLTFIPVFPIYPPETAWMRQPKTDIPGLVIKGRVAYVPADIDRRYARDNMPDHGNLLANIVRWAAADAVPLSVEGRGLIDCSLYRQPGRLVLHIVNLTSTGTWRAPIDELIPIGPFDVRVRLPKNINPQRLKFLVSGASVAAKVDDGSVVFRTGSVLDHEVAVLE